MSGISSNNCKSCGMPFTMEGTTLEAAGGTNGFCVAALVLGIIGIPTSCFPLVSLLAIVFGIIGLNQVNKSGVEGSGKGLAIAGLACGVAGLIFLIKQHMGVELAKDDRRAGEVVMSTEFAIAVASKAAVMMLGAPCLIVFTKSGFSARVVASHRPAVPILVLTDEPRTYRQLALVWGVVPELVPHCNTYDEMVRLALDAVRKHELARPGDRVVVTAGVPFDVPGTTNLLKVETV